MFLLSFPLYLPFDWTLRCWVCVCCFVLFYFGYYVVLCVKKIKKKLLITKKKEYYLSLSPRLRVPVSSLVCAPWQKTSPNRKRRPFTPFCFSFSKVFCFVLVFCLSRGKEVAARHPALARGWCVGVRWDRRECRESSGRELCSVVWFPGCHSPRRAAVHGRSRHRIVTDSMPAGPPLTQCPPDRRWLMPTRLVLTHAPWPPLTLAPWRVHMSQPGVPCVCFVVPTGTF